MEIDEVKELGLDRENLQRIIGRIDGDEGPNLIFFGGIHGNEPAGIIAIQKVIHKIQELSSSFKGTMVGISGNLQALKLNKRYLANDLNRIWFNNFGPHNKPYGDHPEFREKKEILLTIRSVALNMRPTYLFDLHTTSAQGLPFISISDTLKNRELIKNIHVPLVLGLEEQMEGPMFSFFSESGIPSVLFEAGQHDSLYAIENHVSFIWSILKELECISEDDVPEFHQYTELLSRNVLANNKVYELKHIHSIEPYDLFEMKNGYVNFQKVQKGEWLANDRNGKIIAPVSGRIFMPLYQKQGKEGFFIVNRVNRYWLRMGARMRKLGFDKALSAMLGITKNKGIEGGYFIDTNLVSSKVIDVFHLFGYRKKAYFDHRILLTRRPYDREYPSPELLIHNIDEYLKKLEDV